MTGTENWSSGSQGPALAPGSEQYRQEKGAAAPANQKPVTHGSNRPPVFDRRPALIYNRLAREFRILLQGALFESSETMRDAIVLSGWTWDAANVPERIAMSLARSGSRVLYCENPASFLKTVRPFSEVQTGIFAFGLHFLGHRLNVAPPLRALQAKLLAAEILKKAHTVQLRDPVFVYPHGDYCLALSREFKRRGFPLVHVCMDYEIELVREHVRESNLSMVIPRAAYEELRREFGAKVRLVPQISCAERPLGESLDGRELSAIPRPRLGYLGNLTGRASLPLLRDVLVQHPEWHFVSFGREKWLSLANEHVLGWRRPEELGKTVAALDVGFMPYDCAVPKNLHCVPLKLFDYFAQGIPVVSTPIVSLGEYEDVVYVGRTVEELSDAVSHALQEPADSPKKAKRMKIASEHSILRMAPVFASLLEEAARARA